MLRGLRETIGAAAFITLVTIAIAALIGGATLAIIEIGTALSKPAGNAQVTRDTNDAKNQEMASATFNQLWQQIQSYQIQIQNATTDGSDSTDLVALRQTCLVAVGQYNADAQTVTMRPYIPAGDPSSVNLTACN